MRDTCSTLTFRSRTSGWANGVDERLLPEVQDGLLLAAVKRRWRSSPRTLDRNSSYSTQISGLSRPAACLRNCLTTFQFQLDNSIPASPGGAPQTSVGSVDLGSRRGGTPSLLKDQTLGPASAKVGQPVSNGMRLSVQSLSHLSGRPPLAQQP